MNMKNTIYFLIIFVAFILLIQSCRKDNSPYNSPTTTYNYLTTAQLNQSPYFTDKAFDTITYLSDKGDTLTFVKTKTDTTWYCEPTTNNPDNKDQNCYQILHNSYSTIKGNGSFEVKHWMQGYQFINAIDVKFYNISLLYGDYQVGLKNYWTYKNSIKINNKIYNDLIVLYPNSYDSLIAEGYINKDYGLFYFNEKLIANKWVMSK